MGCYARAEGKKLHDPLALATAIDQAVCTFEEVVVWEHKGAWGSTRCPGTGTQIAIDYDHARFVRTLFDLPADTTFAQCAAPPTIACRSKDAPYPCNFDGCAMVFVRPSQLEQHIRAHGDQYPSIDAGAMAESRVRLVDGATNKSLGLVPFKEAIGVARERELVLKRIGKKSSPAVYKLVHSTAAATAAAAGGPATPPHRDGAGTVCSSPHPAPVLHVVPADSAAAAAAAAAGTHHLM
jgi:hypothetical protein